MQFAKCLYCEEEKRIVGRGWCAACYQRYQKSGSVERKPKPVRKICEVDGCDRFVASFGLCALHRARMVRNGHLENTRPNDWGDRSNHPLYSMWREKQRFNKTQSICEKWKHDFWAFVEDIGERPSKRHWLKSIDESIPIAPDNWRWVEPVRCETDEEKKIWARNYGRLHRKENPRKYKNQDLVRKYGITLEDYERMQEEQDNKCAICLKEETALNPKTKEPRGLAVDHCHSAGKVRGLLCSLCNSAIGSLKDDVGLLERAILYLRNEL